MVTVYNSERIQIKSAKGKVHGAKQGPEEIMYKVSFVTPQDTLNSPSYEI